MGTKNTVYLISGGTNYYLSGGAATQQEYSGSGTPWTAESTTPYELSLNDMTGSIWAPAPAPRQMIYTGSPPFRIGRSPLYQGYTITTEPIGVQLRATTKDNAIFLLRQLHQVLNTALFTVPCVLAVQGGTNTVYYEVYSADVSEHVDYISEPDGFFRATIQLTRSPLGGLLSTGETLLNAASFGNTGTGSPDNIVAYSTGSGDLISEGQPLNIKFDPASSAWASLMLASIKSRTYNATGAGAFTSGPTLVQGSSVDCSDLMSNAGLKLRLLIRLSAASSNARFQAIVRYSSSTTAFWATSAPYITPPGTSTQIVDMGPIPIPFRHRTKGMTTPTLRFEIYLYSADGSAATCTFSYSEILFYYDFCYLNLGLDGGAYTFTANDVVLVDTFPEQTNAVCLPYTPQTFVFDTSTTTPVKIGMIRGSPPRYWNGASLYAAWFSNAVGSKVGRGHATTDTATITATHAPLYRTIRGSG